MFEIVSCRLRQSGEIQAAAAFLIFPERLEIEFLRRIFVVHIHHRREVAAVCGIHRFLQSLEAVPGGHQFPGKTRGNPADPGQNRLPGFPGIPGFLRGDLPERNLVLGRRIGIDLSR